MITERIMILLVTRFNLWESQSYLRSGWS